MVEVYVGFTCACSPTWRKKAPQIPLILPRIRVSTADQRRRSTTALLHCAFRPAVGSWLLAPFMQTPRPTTSTVIFRIRWSMQVFEFIDVSFANLRTHNSKPRLLFLNSNRFITAVFVTWGKNVLNHCKKTFLKPSFYATLTNWNSIAHYNTVINRMFSPLSLQERQICATRKNFSVQAAHPKLVFHAPCSAMATKTARAAQMRPCVEVRSKAYKKHSWCRVFICEHFATSPHFRRWYIWNIFSSPCIIRTPALQCKLQRSVVALVRIQSKCSELALL